CLIALDRESPFGSGIYRAGSSPPSPVLLRPPMRFMAMASVSCASLLIEPKDMAPVAKRLMIDSAGSTSSRGTGLSADFRSINPRTVQKRALVELIRSLHCLKILSLLLRAEY